jgi:hypothetical protein
VTALYDYILEYETPRVIRHDNKFRCQELTNLVQLFNIRLKPASNNNPLAQDQVERTNAILLTKLKRMAESSPSEWYLHLQTIAQAHNMTKNRW